MAIGKISGVMLQTNLVRQGVNLQVDTDLAYFDVSNRRLGIGTITPAQSLDVPGNVKLASLSILGNTITSNTGKIGLGTITSIVVTGGTLNNVIITDGTGNLSFTNIGSLPDLIAANAVVSAISANLGAYQTWSNANAASQATSITSLYSNAASQANSINDLYSNIGSYESWANATFVTSTTETQLSANVGAYQLYANATAATQAIAIQSLATGANANTAAYLSTYSGNLNTGNIAGTFYGNIYTNYIFPQTGNVVTISSTGAIQLPSGTTSQEPVGQAGMLRFNSTTNSLEFYSGTSWVSVVNGVSNQRVMPDGVSSTYILNQTATSSSILVSINGVLQQPDLAYSVLGNQITFTEVPYVTDIVDVRFISLTIDNISYQPTVVNAVSIPVTTSNTIVDSFSASQYRSAKYTISSTASADSHMAEIMVTQFNGTALVNTYGVLNTGSNTVNYSANVNGSTINLLARGTTSSNIRVQTTYFLA